MSNAIDLNSIESLGLLAKKRNGNIGVIVRHHSVAYKNIVWFPDCDRWGEIDCCGQFQVVEVRKESSVINTFNSPRKAWANAEVIWKESPSEATIQNGNREIKVSKEKIIIGSEQISAKLLEDIIRVRNNLSC